MLKILVEFGPLIVFLITYKFSNIIKATLWMIASTLACLSISYTVDKKISMPLLISSLILVLSGSITIYSGNSQYIKMKPSIAYLIFAISLYLGEWKKQIILQEILGKAIKMPKAAWMQLSKRASIFFFFMAFINELVWRNYSESFWVEFKVFGAIPLSILFLFSQMPFVNKNTIKDRESNQDLNDK